MMVAAEFYYKYNVINKDKVIVISRIGPSKEEFYYA